VFSSPATLASKSDQAVGNHAPTPKPASNLNDPSAKVVKRYSIFKYEDFQPVLPDAK
jgi:hypothetical protein